MDRMDDRRGTANRAALVVIGLAALGGALWLALGSRGGADDVEGPGRRAEATEGGDVEAADLASAAAAPAHERPARTEAAVVDAAPAPAVEAEAPERDAGLFARAVGPDGEPVEGVAVEWVIRSKLGGVGDSPIRGATGEDGTLEIEDGMRFVEQSFGEGFRASYIASIGLRCAMPFEELAPTEDDDAPGVTWLDEAPGPGAVVDVEVPPHGFVRFTWDPPGDPRGGVLDATWLQVRRSDGDHFPGWRWGGPLEGGATESTFGPIGLGWEVWGQLSVRGMEGRLGSASGAGPAVAGETVEVPIEIPETQRDVVALTGRIVFTRGATARRSRVTMRFGPPDAEDAPIQSMALTEDDRFEVLIARAALPRSVTLLDSYSRTTWTGSCAVPAHDGTHVIDLGDVTVAPLPEVAALPSVSLASGRVVDASGAPVVGAQVSAYGYASRLDERDRDPERSGPLASARTDAEGRFHLEARVRMAREDLRIQAVADGFQRAPMEDASVGDVGVEAVLTRGADVRFRIRIPHWALVTEKVSLRLGRESGPRGDRETAAEEGAHAMRFRGVPDGTHTFVVELGDGDWPLHTQEVSVGGADVDLGLIDLSDALRICRLRLVDAGGAPVTRGFALLGASPGAGRPGRDIDSVRVDDDGGVTFIVPSDAEGLIVGHRTAGTATVPPHAVVRAPDDGQIPRFEVVLGP